MRKVIAFLLSVALLLPLVSAQPYVTVFEGRLADGHAIVVGDYTITIVKSAGGSPYLMLRNGSRILELKPFAFGTEIERDGIRILLGSYTPSGGFIVVSVRPRFIGSLEPRVGATLHFNGTTVEITAIGNRTIDVSVNGIKRTLEINGSAVVDLVALEYDGKEVKVYAAPPASETISAAYTVFYPYGKVKASGSVDLPITVSSTTDAELILPLRVLSLPKGWSASFLYGGVEVGEIVVPPRGTVSLILHIEPAGSGVIRFAVGNFTGTLEVESAGIEVSLPYLSLEAEAGTALSVPVTFAGRGRVEFEPGELPAGWTVYLTDGRYRLRSFEVDGSFTASLVIEVPRNATLGDHRVDFRINGKVYGLDVYVYRTYLGQPAKLTVILTDEAGNPLRGWVAVGDRNLTTSPAGSVELELKPGEYTVIGGAEGCIPAKVRIRLSDGEEKTLKLELKRAEYYFKAKLERDVLVVEPSGSGSTGLIIQNLGSRDDEYHVTVEGLPEGWSYVLSQDPRGTVPIGSLRVRSGESATAYLVIFPPFNAESGEFHVRVMVSGSASRVELPLTVRVENPASLRIEPETPSLVVRAGGSTATRLWVDATGTVTNVKFTVQAPSGWEVEIVPPTLPRIGVESHGNVVTYPGPTQVELRIRVPKSAPAGTYTITVTAAGDQAKAETVITVRVTQGSSGTWIGVVLLILAFGIVIWLMRRVGRR